MSKKTVKITLVRSPIGAQPKHKLCLQGLGLRR
ncbi:MAG: uL30 family ribosomal protein, partial [Pseudohongiellaceae bacterium]